MFSCDGAHTLCQTFWGPLMDQISSVLASARSQIEDEICTFENVEVVLNDHDGMALFEQGVKRIEELGHVVYMKPCGGFVKHKECVTLSVAAGEKCSKLDALRLTTAQGVRTLSQRHIAQAHVLKWLQLGQQPPNGRWRFDVRRRGEKEQCVVNGHVQDFVDVFALVGDLEDVVLEPLASTIFTDQFQVGHELHAHRDMPFAFTRFATSARDVETEMGWFETSGFGM